jgi:putative ABC transport system permease protein
MPDRLSGEVMKKINLKLWRDIGAQKWQFLALVLIILLGVASYGGMMGMIDDVLQSIDRTLHELHMADLVVTFQGSVPEGTAQKVAGLDNVQAVSSRLVMDTGLYISADNQIRARVIGMPTTGQPPVDQLYVTKGRYLQPGDGLVAVLDHHVADFYGYGPGTVLHPIVNGDRLDVTVVGVAVSPEYLLAVPSNESPLPTPSGFAVLFMPETEVQRLFQAQGQISELCILLQDRTAARVDQTIAQIKTALGDTTLRSVTTMQDNPSYSLLTLDLEGGKEMIGAVPTMFLVIAAMSIYVFLSRMVQAQRPQIGVLKAMGYGRRALMSHFLLFAATIAAVGSLGGLVLSYPIDLFMGRAYAAEFGLPFVVAHFHLAAIEAMGITFVFCLGAAAFPAWRSARMAPAQAMHFDPSVAMVKGSVPLLERALDALVHLRISTKIALRNIFRNRRRTLTTALGFVFAFVVLLACWAIFDAMGHMLVVQFRQTDLWDLRAVFSTLQSPAELNQIRSWPGVQTVEPIIELPATLGSATASEDSLLVAIAPNARLHHFQLPRHTAPEQALAPGYILLTPDQARKLLVKTGDEITVQTSRGSARLQVNADNAEVMSAGAYVSLSWLQQQFGLQGYNGLLLQVDAGQRAEVRKMLYQLPGAASVDLKETILTGWKSLMGLYYVMMGAFLAFALMIAGAVIFNTMTVNVLERQREIATMRALGQNRGRLSGMITLENMLIGLLSLLPGLALGSLATYYLFQVFGSAASFNLPSYIAPQTYLIVSALIFATALLSQVPAVRRVNRMDLAEATKVMT